MGFADGDDLLGLVLMPVFSRRHRLAIVPSSVNGKLAPLPGKTLFFPPVFARALSFGGRKRLPLALTPRASPKEEN